MALAGNDPGGATLARELESIASMTKLSTTLPLALIVPLGLGACSGNDAPSPSEVRARIDGDLRNVLQAGAAASNDGSAALPSSAFGLLDRLSGLTVQPSDGTMMSNDSIDALISELDDKIFTDANEVGDGIYQVPPELMCTTVADDGTQAVDPDCATQFSKLEMRIRVGLDGDALTLALQLDKDHDEPLAVTLTHTSLSTQVNLDETGHAIATLAPILGETTPNLQLAGQVTGTIEALGDRAARLSLTIDRPLAIKFADAGISLDGADAFRFASAAADVASIEFDGAAGTGSLAIDLGATTAHIPDDIDPTQATDLDLPGASATATLSATDGLQLTNIGLGDRTTTLTVGGTQAMAIDINPDDGRSFGATFSHDDATGTDTIAVTPRVDIRTQVDHAALGDTPGVYDITQILLDGSLRSTANADQIEIATGAFSIATDPAQFGFSATAGQCVTATETLDDTTGQTYDAWSVGTCQ